MELEGSAEKGLWLGAHSPLPSQPSQPSASCGRPPGLRSRLSASGSLISLEEMEM